MERARIVFAIENEMSTEERNLPANKYWTNVDGERYLQVEEVDEKAFLVESGGDDGDDDAEKKNQQKEENTENGTVEGTEIDF